MTNHLFDTFRNRSPQPDRAFIVLHSGGEERTLSYGALWALSGGLARHLIESGINPGDRIAAQIEKSIEGIVLYLAAIRAGAVWMPLNNAYGPNELSYFLNDAKPSLFVCDPLRSAELKPIASAAGIPAVETLSADGRSGSLTACLSEDSQGLSPAARGPNDPAAILYTSGTTGRAKGAVLSHENLASNALTLSALWHFTSADRLLHALPIFHIHGLFVALNVSLVSGATILCLPRFDVDDILRLLPETTVMMGVPTFYIRLLQHSGLTKRSAAGVRLFISGSAPLLEDTHCAWVERTGHRILERYGMTETNMNASNPYDGERRPGTVGLALPGVTLRVTEPETGTILPFGETGMIEVRGPNVFRGYWGRLDSASTDFRPDGFFITGDLGQFDPDGYLRIVGRAKDLVISGGYNVYPREVEAEIDTLDGVVETAVIGLPHPDFGEAVTAVIVLASGAVLDEKTVLGALQGRLAKYKQPKRVLFAEELPRNALGKVQKNLLRQAYANLFEPAPEG